MYVFEYLKIKQKVHIVLNSCRTHNLCSNTLGDWSILLVDEGQQIKWFCFTTLVNIQTKIEISNN